MKNKYFLIFILLVPALSIFGQVGINTDGSQPDPSAGLDVKFSNRGLLPPRMSTASRDLITNPASGLLIFNTDCNDIQFFNGSFWVPVGNIGMIANPGPINGLTTPCEYSTGLVYSIAEIPGATGYNWMVPPGATIMSGQGSSSITVNLGATSGQICVSAFNNCLRSNMSCLSINIIPVLPASVSITASGNDVCAGVEVTFSANPENEGILPTYQWEVNGNIVGANLPNFTYAPENNDVILCKMTPDNPCAGGGPVNSNIITMTVNPLSPVSISISASDENICTGSMVTFSSTIVNGGTSPLYNWKINGISVGINDPMFIYIPTDNDIVSCSLTSNILCATGNSAVSNEVAIDVFPILEADAIITNLSCNNSGDGSITIIPTSGTAPYQYSWSNGFTGAINSGLSAGTYSLTLTDANLCSFTGNWTVTEPGEISWTGTTADVTCFGADDGQINTTEVAGGTSPYNFSWSGPNGFTSTAMNLNGLTTGVYQLTITDSHGCFLTVSREISGPEVFAIQPVFTISGPSCAGLCNGSISNIQISGGSPPYLFYWSNGSTTGDISNLCAGTYILTVTDTHNCMITKDFTLTQPLPLETVPAISSTTCSGLCDGSISVTVSGGTPAYSYSWSNGVTTSAISALCAGTYSVTISDVNGCMLTPSLEVTSPPEMVVTSDSVIDLTCNGSLNGAIGIDVSGGTPPYNFLWNNGASTRDVAGLSAGLYSVTVTDQNSCTSSNSWTVFEPEAISWTGFETNVSCFGAQDGAITTNVSAGGTPPYSFDWVGPNGFHETTPNILSLEPGTYQLILTDSQGCALNLAREISQPDSLSITGTATATSCGGGCDGLINTSVIGGTPPFTWQWSNTATTEDLSDLCPGNYALTLTDNHNCQINGSWTVEATEQLPVSVAISASVNPVIAGTEVTFTASPVNGGSAPVYQWKKNGVNTGTNSESFTCIPIDHDTITCTMTSDLSCVSGNPATSGMVVMEVIPLAPTCPGIPTITYLGKIYHTVQIGDQCWIKENLDAGIKIPGIQDQSNNGIVEKYCYEDLESNCDTYGGLYQWNEVMNYTPSAVEGQSNRQGICPQGWHLPSEAEWCQAETFLDSLVNCTISGLSGSKVGAKMKESGTLHWASPNSGATNASGFTALPGGKRANDGGGFNLLTTDGMYWSSVESSANEAWSRALNFNSSQINRSASEKSAGFSVRCVKDTCTSYSNASVTIEVSGNNLCAGTQVGFTANPVNGGANPFYIWRVNGISSGITEDTFTHIPNPGDLVDCMMFSSVPCSSAPVLSNSITMMVRPSPELSAVVTNETGCNPGNGAIDLTTTSGTTPYQFSWDNGATTEDLSGLTMGIYTITVTDADLCSTTQSYEVLDPGEVSWVGYTDNITCKGANDGKITTVVTLGGTPPYNFTWSNGATTSDLTGLTPGWYQVTVTDNQGCDARSARLILEPEVLSIEGFITNASCQGLCDGSIDITVSGGTPDYFYSWSNGSTIEDLTDLCAGTWSVTVTDINNCPAATGSWVVTATVPLPVGISILPSANPVSAGTSVTFTAVVENAGTSPVYQWFRNGLPTGDNMSAYTVTPDNGDTFQCRVTSDLMCASGNPAMSEVVVMVVN